MNGGTSWERRVLDELQRGPAILADLAERVGLSVGIVDRIVRILAQRGVARADTRGDPPVTTWTVAGGERPDASSAPRACKACCAALLPLADLAAKAARAHERIRDRKLTVPDAVMSDLQQLAAQLRCRAELCGGEPTT